MDKITGKLNNDKVNDLIFFLNSERDSAESYLKQVKSGDIKLRLKGRKVAFEATLQFVMSLIDE